MLTPEMGFMTLEVLGKGRRIRSLDDYNYQLPNGPVKAGRRWGQRHPQGANLGSNGILKFLSKTHTTDDEGQDDGMCLPSSSRGDKHIVCLCACHSVTVWVRHAILIQL